MELSKEETTKRENIIARSDKAMAELNDNSRRHEKLLRLFKFWQEEDSKEDQKCKELKRSQVSDN